MLGSGTDAAALLLALGAGAVSLGLLGLAGRAIPTTRTRAVVGALAALVLAGFSAAAAALGWPASSWLPPLALAGVCGLFFAIRAPAVRRTVARAATPSVQWCALLVAGVSLLFWYASRAGSDPPAPARPVEDVQAQRMRAMASLREVPSPVALTDGGRRVRLHTMPESALPPAMLRSMEAEMAQEWGPSLRLIRTSPPGGRSDCHGWVFGDGGWWILGADVGAILQDNGYEPVTEPAAGDLVVYRLGSGRITHTGVVSAVGRGGSVLVESKWAWLGTYLHAPDCHPYGGRPAYHRSARAGHRLNLVPAQQLSPSR